MKLPYRLLEGNDYVSAILFGCPEIKYHMTSRAVAQDAKVDSVRNSQKKSTS